MTYYRRSLGQPVTDPSQVDDTIVIGEIKPKRVDCASLPADSPWKRPGQVCEPSFWDFLRDLVPSSPDTPNTTPATSPPFVDPSGPGWPPAESSLLPLALLALGGLGAYYILRKKKKRP